MAGNSVLRTLAESVQHCTNCELHGNATQAVFSEGPPRAKVMMIGEAPGNDEDLAGRPFVGPAGRLLRELLAESGFDEAEIYLTNAVKHFKWQPRGDRRLHVTPSYREVTACKPWLQKELEAVQPRVVVCLGAIAAQSLLGSDFRVTRHRGEVFTLPNHLLLTTIHPSVVLRMPTSEGRAQARSELLGDLMQARELSTMKPARTHIATNQASM